MVAEVIENVVEEGAVEDAPKVIYLSRAALAAAQLAANDESRPILNTVWTRNDRAETCDGFMGASIELPGPAPELRIRRDDALKAMKRTNRKVRGVTVEPLSDREARLETAYKPTEPLIAETIDGHAPSVGQLMKDTAPRAVVNLSVKRMKQMFTFLTDALDDGEKQSDPQVEMRVFNDREGVEFRAFTPDEHKLRAILMPMVIDFSIDKTGWVFDEVEGVNRRDVGQPDLRRVLADEPKEVADQIALAEPHERTAIIENVLTALGHEDQIDAVNALLAEAVMKEAING